MSFPYPNQRFTTNLGLSLFGMDEVLADNMNLIDAAYGAGSSINVNGTLVTSPNLSNTTPAAPVGKTNVLWQFDSNGNISGYVTPGGGGSTPGGPTNSIQYNAAGTLGGLGSFSIDPTTGEVSITDTASGPTGLAAFSVFGNQQGDNIQDWYMGGVTAGSPDVYLDRDAVLNWANDAFLTAPGQMILTSGGLDVFSASGSGATQVVTIANSNDTDVSLDASDGSLHLDSSGITYMGADGGVLIGVNTPGGAQGSGTLNATGLFVNGVAVGTGSGTVTSVSSGNIGTIINVSVATPTSTPAFSFAIVAQSANTVWAGPTSGGAVAPTFRALVAGDLPAGTGTVTSFSAGTLSPLFTTSVATATTTPALSFALSNAGGGTVFGNNTTSAAAPVYTIAPVLGIPGTSTGSIALASSTASGKFTITAPASASTPTLTLPTTSNVLAGQFAGDNVIYTSTLQVASAAGTLTPSLLTQTANVVLSGPTSGGAATPTFRSLVAADIPSLPYIPTSVMTTLGDLIYGGASGAATRLAGQTTSTKEYLSQTGNGSISAAPAWAQINYADIAGTTPTPPAGAVLWSALGNASGNLTLSNGANTTEFDQTSGIAWTWANTTASTQTITYAYSTGTGTTSAVASVSIAVGDTVLVTTTAAGGGQCTLADNGSAGGNTYTQLFASTSQLFGKVWQLLSATKTATTITATQASATGVNLCVVVIKGASSVSIGNSDATTIGNTNAGTNTMQPSSSTGLILTFYQASPTTTSQAIAAPWTSKASVAAVSSPAACYNSIWLYGQENIQAVTAVLSQNNGGGIQSWTVEVLNAANATAQSSPTHVFKGSYWTGAASAADTWTVQNIPGGASNGLALLNFSHSGSAGTAALQIPCLYVSDSTNNVDLILSNTTAGTGGTTNASPKSMYLANFFNGTISLPDTWTIGSSLASGTNGASTLTFTHSGSTGNAAVRVPVLNIGGTNAGISQLGAASLAFGNGTSADTTANLSFNKIIKYAGTNTVSQGVPYEIVVVDLTAQTAAITATTLISAPQTGMYRITWSADITTAASSSSVLGGSNGFQVIFTSPTDSVAKTTVSGNSITSAGNTTATALGGSIVVYAKTGTNIQYQYDYTSVGGTAMVYELHIKLEAL